jgi:hypothetical protein
METDQSLLSETQRKKQQILYQICSKIQVCEDSQTTPQRPDVYEEKRKERETREMEEWRQRTLNDKRSERRRMLLLSATTTAAAALQKILKVPDFSYWQNFPKRETKYQKIRKWSVFVVSVATSEKKNNKNLQSSTIDF